MWYVVNKNSLANIVSGFSLSLAVFFVVLYQALGEAPDWANYDEFLKLLRMPDPDFGIYDRFEPGFVAINKFLVNFFSTNLAVYGVVAIGAILLKAWSVNFFSRGWSAFLIALIFYFSRFFPLHEYTQLRAAFSISLFFLAIVYATRGRIFSTTLASAAALTFHMSATVLIPFLILFFFLVREKQSFRLKWAIFISIFVFVFTKALVALVLTSLQDHLAVVSLYQEAGFGSEAANPFSVALILDIGMIAAGVVMWSGLPLLMRFILFIELVGMAVFYATFEYQVIAFRVREFICAFWTLFVAMGVGEEYKIRVVTYIFTVASVFLYSYIFFIKGGFFVE